MFLLIPSLAVLLTTLASMMVQAQDANCSAIYNDFTPSPTLQGAYQKCYTDQLFNAALVAEGTDPDYNQVLTRICTKPAACSQSTLASATKQYIAACGASIDAEAVNLNILQTGKNALQIFFADPIRSIYCTLDPNPPTSGSPPPPPPPPPALPAVVPPSYCLAKTVSSSTPTTQFTPGANPFFENLDPADTCSICSQLVLKETVAFLSENLMPRIGFYTPEFVQYWSRLVVAYNAQCKTAIVQEWPEGTLNETLIPGLTPTGASPSAPNTTLPLPTPESTHPNGHGRSGATSLDWRSVSSIAVLLGSLLIFNAL
ncbi:hypothetical protein BGZ68_001129 [Mortierella alpina]|nr:hypothetical protein BGZ68_001129 [Mortierella alpina]